MYLKNFQQIRQCKEIFIYTFEKFRPKNSAAPEGIVPPLTSLWRSPVSASPPYVPGGAHAQSSGRDDAVPGPTERGLLFSFFLAPASFWNLNLNSSQTISLIFKILIPLFFSRRDLYNDVDYFAFDENLWNSENLKFQFEFQLKNVFRDYFFFWNAEQLWSL